MGVASLAVLAATLALSSWQPAAGSPQPDLDRRDLLQAASSPPPASPASQIKLGEEPSDPAKKKAAAVSRARTHLAKKLGVEPAAITLESAAPATWPDAALGCPEKDRMYAQVVTSGYKVILAVDGKTHEVHVAGTRAVSCPASTAKYPTP